jgi:hypothetical protein
LRLEVCSALDGTELADVQYGARDRIFRADRIRYDCPDVRVRLEQKRDALDRGGIRTFAAIGQALFDESTRVREQSDAAAGSALAAEIIAKPLAVGGLREHSREGKFPDASRTAEQHGVRDALAREHAAERSYHTRVADEFRKTQEGLLEFMVLPLPATERATPRL